MSDPDFPFYNQFCAAINGTKSDNTHVYCPVGQADPPGCNGEVEGELELVRVRQWVNKLPRSGVVCVPISHLQVVPGGWKRFQVNLDQRVPIENHEWWQRTRHPGPALRCNGCPCTARLQGAPSQSHHCAQSHLGCHRCIKRSDSYLQLIIDL